MPKNNNSKLFLTKSTILIRLEAKLGVTRIYVRIVFVGFILQTAYQQVSVFYVAKKKNLIKMLW